MVPNIFATFRYEKRYVYVDYYEIWKLTSSLRFPSSAACSSGVPPSASPFNTAASTVLNQNQANVLVVKPEKWRTEFCVYNTRGVGIHSDALRTQLTSFLSLLSGHIETDERSGVDPT